MYLITDGVRIIPGCCNKKIQRLHTGITRTLGHYIIEFSIWLGVQLIKDYSVCIKAMLVCNIRRQNLVGTVGRLIDDLLLRFQYLHSFHKSRAEPYHINGNIKYDFCLVSVCCTSVHFCSFFSITT